MKKKCILSILTLALVSTTATLVSCNKKKPSSNISSSLNTDTSQTSSLDEFIDYADQLELDKNDGKLWEEVTVKTYVDGDTTHFNSNIPADKVLKARYLAVDTPESTSKVQPWGKAASNFTKEALKSADSIIIQSDDNNWNIDSTGNRYMVWVWYRKEGTTKYRLLNLELMQNGLASAKNYAQTSYGEIFGKAFAQARAHKLKFWSDENDPDFYYGERLPVTFKELRLNPENYVGVKIRVDGYVSKCHENAFYMESFDEEDQKYYGMYCYSISSPFDFGLPGNKVSLTARLELYETAGTYQLSDITYYAMDEENENSSRLLEESSTHKYQPHEIKGSDITGKSKIIVVGDDGEEIEKEFDNGYLAESTFVQMKNLKVQDIYTTKNENSSSKGAMTITCKDSDGNTITVRTLVLTKKVNGQLVTVTEDEFKNQTIDVTGVIDCFDGQYQIKVLSYNDIKIVE